MNTKLTVAILVTACAGCGGQPRNAGDDERVFAGNAGQAIGATSVTRDTGADAILIENACNAISECRTTAQGLGV